ncbi:MAG: YihY/virulence factor BrkB family protein [Thermoanaerobaculia bacterium]
MSLNWAGWKKLIVETASNWNAHDATSRSAALAFYTMFSLAPILILVVSIAGAFFGEQAVRGQIVQQFGSLMGHAEALAVQEMLKKVVRSEGALLARILGALTLLFGATGAFVELQDALNRVWDVAPKPGAALRVLLRKRFISFGLILGIGFLLMVSLALSAALGALESYIQRHTSLPVLLLEGGNALLSIFVFGLLIALIYRILPDAVLAWRDVWLGALVTSMLFGIGKWLIGLYLGGTAVGSAYGAAGSLVVILSWVYYTSFIILFGAEFTRAYCHTVHPIRVKPEPGAVKIPKADPDQPLPAR